ncbi:metallophosphoesterase family protein [Roseivirga echinicomitans]
MKGGKINNSRRKFLKSSGLVTLSTFLPLSFYACQPDQNSKIRFGLTTDSHYADRENAGTRYYRDSIDKMNEFVAVMNREKVDFVTHLGDFKDEDLNKEATDTLRYLETLERAYGKFNGPRYHCIGNHDVDSITKSQFLSNIENTGIDKSKSYYSFDKNGFHFIVLDANYHADGRDQFYKEGADWQDANIPEVQYNWLQQDLENNELPTIVFCHHPLYEFSKPDAKFHVNDYHKFQQLFEVSGKVLAVFQGHVHEEAHTEINGIHYVTQLGMVDYEGLENNSFAIVEIDDQAIHIKGYKRVGNQTLAV